MNESQSHTDSAEDFSRFFDYDRYYGDADDPESQTLSHAVSSNIVTRLRPCEGPADPSETGASSSTEGELVPLLWPLQVPGNQMEPAQQLYEPSKTKPHLASMDRPMQGASTSNQYEGRALSISVQGRHTSVSLL